MFPFVVLAFAPALDPSAATPAAAAVQCELNAATLGLKGVLQPGATQNALRAATASDPCAAAPLVPMRVAVLDDDQPSYASPSASKSSTPPRFTLEVSGGGEVQSLRSATVIPTFSQSGYYVVASPSPSGPITYPGGSFEGAPGSNQGPTSSPTGAVTRLKTDATGERLEIKLGYAPDGFDRSDWRFSVGADLNDGTISQRLPGTPLSAGAPNISTGAAPAVSCIILSVFTGQCADFGLAVPFTRNVFMIPGSFNSPFQTQINTYVVDQKDTKFSTDGAIERVFHTPSPIGELQPSIGLELASSWWSFKEDRTIGAYQNGPQTAFLVGDQISGEGPTFSAKATFGVSGLIHDGWPIRWRLFGDTGADWAQLSLHGEDGVGGEIDRVHAAYGYGGELSYAITRGLSSVLTVQQQRTPYVASWLAPGGAGAGVTLNDAMGSTVDIREASTLIYTLSLRYRF